MFYLTYMTLFFFSKAPLQKNRPFSAWRNPKLVAVMPFSHRRLRCEMQPTF